MQNDQDSESVLGKRRKRSSQSSRVKKQTEQLNNEDLSTGILGHLSDNGLHNSANNSESSDEEQGNTSNDRSFNDLIQDSQKKLPKPRSP